MAEIAACDALCPNTTAPSICSSVNSWASDSTMRTALWVPATTRSSAEATSCVALGLRTYSPSIKPTRAAPIGPLKGTPEMDSAADAPTIATTSGSISGSTDRIVAITCTSLLKPSGKRGRIGRSMRRQVKMAFSEGRPSRLKKPPGILPAA